MKEAKDGEIQKLRKEFFKLKKLKKEMDKEISELKKELSGLKKNTSKNKGKGSQIKKKTNSEDSGNISKTACPSLCGSNLKRISLGNKNIEVCSCGFRRVV